MGVVEQTTALVETLYNAYNSRRIDDVAALYATDGTHEDIAHGRLKVGAGAIVEGFQKFIDWFPDAEWKLGSIIVGTNKKAAVEYALTGTLSTAMGPIVPRGQKISLRGLMVLTIENQKISRSEDYWDATTFQKQLTFNTPEDKL